MARLKFVMAIVKFRGFVAWMLPDKCAAMGLYEGCGHVSKCFIQLGVTSSVDMTIKSGV